MEAPELAPEHPRTTIDKVDFWRVSCTSPAVDIEGCAVRHDQMREDRAVTEAKLDKACVKLAVEIRHETAKVHIIIKHRVKPHAKIKKAVNKANTLTIKHNTEMRYRTAPAPCWKVHADGFCGIER